MQATALQATAAQQGMLTYDITAIALPLPSVSMVLNVPHQLQHMHLLLLTAGTTIHLSIGEGS